MQHTCFRGLKLLRKQNEDDYAINRFLEGTSSASGAADNGGGGGGPGLYHISLQVDQPASPENHQRAHGERARGRRRVGEREREEELGERRRMRIQEQEGV